MKNNKRKKNPVSLEIALADFLSPELKGRGVSSYSLLLMWQDVLGEKLSEDVFLKEILHKRSGKKILHIVARTDALALNISYLKSSVIEKVNTMLGQGYISELKVSVTGMEEFESISKRYVFDNDVKNLDCICKKESNERLKEVEDEDLRNALYNLSLLI